MFKIKLPFLIDPSIRESKTSKYTSTHIQYYNLLIEYTSIGIYFYQNKLTITN